MPSACSFAEVMDKVPSALKQTRQKRKWAETIMILGPPSVDWIRPSDEDTALTVTLVIEFPERVTL
jgi:hypothetical protein